MQRRRRNAVRNDGFSLTVSARALIILDPTAGSFAQPGINPQRIAVRARWARQTGEWRPFWLGLVLVAAFSVFLNRWFGFPFAGPVVNKAGNDMLLTGAMAISMSAGMFAQYLYRYFESPMRYRRKWDWGCFIAPIFASPIIFIPLAAAFQNADVDLTNDRMTLPRMMIFLVAFENGFFWKEYFDRERKQIERSKR